MYKTNQPQSPLRTEARHNRRVILLLLGCLLLTVVFSLYVGRYHSNSRDTLRLLAAKLFPFLPIEQTWADTFDTVVMKIRLPRILAAVLVGGGLALAGTSYQGVFKNPLVSSDILGASAGAAFGASLAIFLDFSDSLIQICSFLFGITAVFAAYFIAGRMKRDPTLSLILAGMLIGSLNTAFVSLLKFLADPNNKLPVITFWLLGSLSSMELEDFIPILLPMAAGVLPLLLLRWRINVLSLGDADAKTLGVNVKAMRVLVIFCATMITAASVSVAGLIGWVGLVVPNLCRQALGSDNRLLMPASWIAGGIFLLLVDNVARSISMTEIPLGVLTAILGAPFFAVLVMQKEKEP